MSGKQNGGQDKEIEGGQDTATDPDWLRQRNCHVLPHMLNGIGGKCFFK